MSKTNKKSINYGLKILAILAFGLIFTPFKTTMAAYGTNVSDYLTGYPQVVNNPEPYINSINPSVSDKGSVSKIVTIEGSGFFPGSVARVNGSNRNTTFIDDSHLLLKLSGNDMYLNNGFFISVFNGAPGGGYSNAVTFTLNNVSGVSSNTNGSNGNNSNSNSSANTSNTSSNTSSSSNASSTNSDSSYTSNLASSVILGSPTGFLPSGLVQWILLAIIILVIIILVRKIFGAEENYHNSPLKHA